MTRFRIQCGTDLSADELRKLDEITDWLAQAGHRKRGLRFGRPSGVRWCIDVAYGVMLREKHHANFANSKPMPGEHIPPVIQSPNRFGSI